jgi:hypothetical protein
METTTVRGFLNVAHNLNYLEDAAPWTYNKTVSKTAFQPPDAGIRFPSCSSPRQARVAPRP